MGPGKVANPACDQLNRKNEYFPVPVLAPRIWFRKTGSAVPSRVSLLILQTTQAVSGAYSRDSCRFPSPLDFRRLVHFLFKPPQGQSRVYPVEQLRIDGIHCQESAGTGPVVLKEVPVTGAAFASPWTSYCASLFSHTHYWYEVGMLKVGLQLADYNSPKSVNED